jgi:hypothetical protein
LRSSDTPSDAFTDSGNGLTTAVPCGTECIIRAARAKKGSWTVDSDAVDAVARAEADAGRAD